MTVLCSLMRLCVGGKDAGVEKTLPCLKIQGIWPCLKAQKIEESAVVAEARRTA